MTVLRPGPRAAQLRGRLRINAAISASTGTAALVAAPAIARALGLDARLGVRAIGVSLLLFAAGLVLLARADAVSLSRGAAVVVGADATWVVGTVLTLLILRPPSRGQVMLIFTGLIVAILATVQWQALRDLRRPTEQSMDHETVRGAEAGR